MVTSLPKDIIELLCTYYLPPQAALSLLTTTKQLHKHLSLTLLKKMKEKYAIRLIKKCDLCASSGYLSNWEKDNLFTGTKKPFYCKKCNRYVIGVDSVSKLTGHFDIPKYSSDPIYYGGMETEIKNNGKNRYCRTADYLKSCGLSQIAFPTVPSTYFLACAHDIENRTILLENHHLHHVVYPRQIQREKDARNIENSWYNLHYVFSLALASFFVVSSMYMLSNK
jgi:hypothetical protein